jgi:ribosomal protein S18 acetylase RimI-like enzyme
MKVVDWRRADPGAIRPLYEAGQSRWLHALGWDMSDTWRALEHARTTWGLPGLLARDRAGVVRGWTFFLHDRGVVQVGGLAADTVDATRALVDGLVDFVDTRTADAVSCFTFDEAPGLVEELTRRGFGITPFAYLSRDLARDDESTVRLPVRGWRESDITAAATLLRASYSEEAGRHFAPGHTAVAWERYVHNLVSHTGCGSLLPDLTRVVADESGMQALVLVTALSSATVHLAQVAVAPPLQGRGLARELITQVCRASSRQGFHTVTLLVDRANQPACAMYRRVGFAERARFIAAER